MKKVFEYFITPISLLGVGCLEELKNYLKPMSFRKALIVTDKVLVDTGLVDKLYTFLIGKEFCT
ncbi:hypothetical protein N752_16730 [Desulforamulus aquiferis]|nr:hypothetical protein N752_16730 [Desulforamulus aquiferis]